MSGQEWSQARRYNALRNLAISVLVKEQVQFQVLLRGERAYRSFNMRITVVHDDGDGNFTITIHSLWNLAVAHVQQDDTLNVKRAFDEFRCAIIYLVHWSTNEEIRPC